MAAWVQAVHRFARWWRRLRRDQRGAVAMIVGLAIVPLMLAAGLAVDAGRLMAARARLAQATDAAALAAGPIAGSDAFEEKARRILEANFPTGDGVEITDLDLSFDESNGRVTLVTRARMPTTFMRLAAIEEMEFEARTVVVREVSPMELVLVLDVTGSMRGSKIQALKAAAKDLVNILFGDAPRSDNLRIGIVPFNARVNVGAQRRSWIVPQSLPNGRFQLRGDFVGCVEARSKARALTDDPPSVERFPATEVHLKDSNPSWSTRRNARHRRFVRNWLRGSCPPPILPLTGDKGKIMAKINSLPATSNTRIDMGARWGWRVLSRRWEGLWGEDPRKPAQEVITAMVIMTDGVNTRNSYLEHNDIRSARDADQNLLTLCERIKRAGTVLYTITFKAPSRADQLMRSCATSPAHYFRSPTNEDLRRAFRTIAGELSALRIAE